MASPTTRDQFKENCLRRLGKPVIEINVDDDQVEVTIRCAADGFSLPTLFMGNAHTSFTMNLLG